MNEKKVISYCQLAMKAGRTAVGDRLLRSITQGSAQLVLYSSDTGENRKKKIQDKCHSFHVECLECPPGLLEKVTGRNMNSLAVTDAGFARAILREVKG